MSENNVVNNKPGSIEEIPYLPYELQRRSKVVGRTQSGIVARNTANASEQTLWTQEIFRGDYSENSCFEIYGFLKFTNNTNNKTTRFKMNGTTILSIANVQKTVCAYKKLVFNLNSFTQQIAYPQGTNGDWGETGVTENMYSIDTTNSIIFTITTQVSTPGEIGSLLAAYVRVNY